MKYPIDTTGDPMDAVTAMSKDISTLVMRLMGEDRSTFAPETADVMARWEPFVMEQVKIFSDGVTKQ